MQENKEQNAVPHEIAKDWPVVITRPAMRAMLRYDRRKDIPEGHAWAAMKLAILYCSRRLDGGPITLDDVALAISETDRAQCPPVAYVSAGLSALLAGS